jgi:hypothetical protein
MVSISSAGMSYAWQPVVYLGALGARHVCVLGLPTWSSLSELQVACSMDAASTRLQYTCSEGVPGLGPGW